MKWRYALVAATGLLTGVLLLLALLSPRVAGRRPGHLVAPWSPIELSFNRPMDPDAVGERFSIEPAVEGGLTVDGRRVVFKPSEPLAYNRRYTATLASGATALNGLPLLRDAQYAFSLSPPRLLYLLERDGAANVWLIDGEGDRRRLTDEAAGVWDYAPLPDGGGLVYSAMKAEDETMDLVLLTHDGRHELLLACEDAQCRSPAPQPGGRLIAYERQPFDRGLGATELWLLDLDTGQTTPLAAPADLVTAGFEGPLGRHAQWSDDGRKLAIYRPDANMIVVHDFAAADAVEPLLIPAHLESMGGWSPDGRRLAYTEMAFGETDPHAHEDESGVVISHTRPSLYEHVIVVDLDGRESTDISAGLEIDEGRPAWRPGDDLLAVARTATGAGRQLTLVKPDGSAATQLTDDPFHNHTALAWSPDGRYLAFMRVPRADGAKGPTIMLYDMQTGEMMEVAEGAFLPGWWP